LINAARNTGGSIGEVCSRRSNLRPGAILVNERPDGRQVSHGMLANLPAFATTGRLCCRAASRLENRKPSSKVRLTAFAAGR
jgi:hypothetical protein